MASASIVLLVCMSGSCSSDSPAENTKQDITECMGGNGGVVAKEMETRVEDGVLHVDSVSYNGRGSDSYDAVFIECFRSVAKEMKLEVGSTITPLRP